MEKHENQLNIELSQDVAEGTYANLAVISHSSSEFVLDFIRIMPGTPQANVKSRVILAPEHAKRLLLALKDNIAKFESLFGEITLPENQAGGGNMPMGFGGGEA